MSEPKSDPESEHVVTVAPGGSAAITHHPPQEQCVAERTGRGSDDEYCSWYPSDGHHYVGHSVDAPPIRWVDRCSLCGHISSGALRRQLVTYAPKPGVVRVAGWCPMGCGQTLYLYAGRVTCADTECPTPDAAAVILDDPEPEHIVTFEVEEFGIRHPLRERLWDDLENCHLHRYIRELSGPPVPPGRYRARLLDTGTGPVWTWELLP